MKRWFSNHPPIRGVIGAKTGVGDPPCRQGEAIGKITIGLAPKKGKEGGPVV